MRRDSAAAAQRARCIDRGSARRARVDVAGQAQRRAIVRTGADAARRRLRHDLPFL